LRGILDHVGAMGWAFGHAGECSKLIAKMQLLMIERAT
jgi:hypothetical protein